MSFKGELKFNITFSLLLVVLYLPLNVWSSEDIGGLSNRLISPLHEDEAISPSKQEKTKPYFNASSLFFYRGTQNSTFNYSFQSKELSHLALNSDNDSLALEETLDNSAIKPTENSTRPPIHPTEHISSNIADNYYPNYRRTTLEIGIFLGVGLLGYNYWQERMRADWEFSFDSFSDVSRRFLTTEQIKYDDNSVNFNWGHVYAGSMYYQAGRVNGFNSYQSTLISITSSSIWEYVIEFREAVSISDQIMTGFGGAILGETFHQISSLLKRRSKTSFSKFLAAYFQPVDIVQNIFDEYKITMPDAPIRPTYISRNNDEWFELEFGVSQAKRDHYETVNLIDLGFRGEVINLPVKSEGKIKNKLILDTVAVEMIQNFGISTKGLRDYYSFTKVVPLGFFTKEISENQSGYTLYFGPAMATEYNSAGLQHSQDFYGVVNLIGATIDTTFHQHNKSLRLAFDAYGDFAFVRPYGMQQYFASGKNFDAVKTILSKKDYYYALGTSLRSRIEAQPTDKLTLGIIGVYHKFKSIDEGSRDRRAERVTRNIDLEDRVASLKAWVSFKFKHRWKISGSFERLFRSGAIDEAISSVNKSFYYSDYENTYKINFNYDIL